MLMQGTLNDDIALLPSHALDWPSNVHQVAKGTKHQCAQCFNTVIVLTHSCELRRKKDTFWIHTQGPHILYLLIMVEYLRPMTQAMPASTIWCLHSMQCDLMWYCIFIQSVLSLAQRPFYLYAKTARIDFYYWRSNTLTYILSHLILKSSCLL